MTDMRYEVGRDVGMDVAESMKLFSRLASSDHGVGAVPLTADEIRNAEVRCFLWCPIEIQSMLSDCFEC